MGPPCQQKCTCEPFFYLDGDQGCKPCALEANTANCVEFTPEGQVSGDMPHHHTPRERLATPYSGGVHHVVVAAAAAAAVRSSHEARQAAQQGL